MELHQLPSNDSTVRVRLQGMLDLPGVTRVETAFLGATVSTGRDSIVDMSQVTFIASLGLSMLLSATKALKRKGARLILLAPTPEVTSVFSEAHLLNVLLIARDEAEISALMASPVGL